MPNTTARAARPVIDARHAPSTVWRPTLGAWLESNGVRFRVWAPDADTIQVVLDAPATSSFPLDRFPDGTFGGFMPGLGAGTRYRYRIDQTRSLPDPASRFQPDGVHGPSEVVDPLVFRWTDHEWTGVARADLVLYELHVGTFTEEGTFRAVTQRLPYLARLGITALELMPVADFPGSRNWGYDGVDLFAPARRYGSPSDLRELIDTAHSLQLAVILDVVYNHLGPEGNYLPSFSRHYVSDRHRNPWGSSLNFDGPNSSMVRQFFIENALHWVHEYHVDGLRLDATHAIVDEDPRPFVAQLATRVRESAPRPVLVFAEDHRNLAHMIRPEGEGGWNLDGVWADDFHHKVRVALTGDNEGYYRDYTGTMRNLANTLNRGWHFVGQYSHYLQDHRGTDPVGIPPRRFIFCIQNHDQVGNRAFGERLHHVIDLPSYRAATTLLLCAPATPLLFMGQEWASTAPFLYFTDHPEDLGRRVTEGRRNEFRHFSAFTDPEQRNRIPDPQAESTFTSSQLKWAEIESEPHASVHRLYQRLLSLRGSEPSIRSGRFSAIALSDTVIVLRQDADEGPSLLVVIQLRGASTVDLADSPGLEGLDLARCQLLFTTEDRPFAPDALPPSVVLDAPAPLIRFARPSAVVFSVWPAAR
jgi:maltooligosyltrehalose trehalohydrolase